MSKSLLIINEETCTRVKLFGIDVCNLFTKNGYKLTNNIKKADIVIINSCSFLKSKEEYFLKLIKNENHNLKSNQKLIVIGCLPSIDAQKLKEINPDIILFGRNLAEIKEYFKFKNDIKMYTIKVKDKLTLKNQMLYFLNKFFLHSPHIYYRLKRDKVCYLQISRGCLGNCTYCSEKFTTKLYSRPIEEIMKSIHYGINNGYKYFALNSDDASAYGKDINSSLNDLLNEIIKIDKDIFFSIPEMNPNALNESVVQKLKDKKFLYITVPIQSGSDVILNKMGRTYLIEDIIPKLRQIKQNNPNIKINTHIIVGFPGETDDDFNKTKNLLETGIFDRVKVFMYNERPKTESIKMGNKIDNETKLKRRNELLKVVKKNNIKNFSLTNLILNTNQLK